MERLEVDRAAADAALLQQPFDFGFPLRDYQREAIKAVEAGLAAGADHMLLAMATGTGKTKLAIAMLYRPRASSRPPRSSAARASPRFSASRASAT